ncbi:hypothetical protein GQ600_11698 [Phytophthora cactorum]|nr:hypothetical protein GQ600_11698 [Phytophthora cactorum]
MSSASLHFITVCTQNHLNYSLHLRRSAERQRRAGKIHAQMQQQKITPIESIKLPEA